MGCGCAADVQFGATEAVGWVVVTDGGCVVEVDGRCVVFVDESDAYAAGVDSGAGFEVVRVVV